METKEYRTIDKASWERGPWDSECDKVQWPDPTTGLPCIAKRHESMGFLCGYVGVPPGHPLHGKGYDDAKNADGEYIDVHGGITYANSCVGDEQTGICHVPGPGEPHDVWWFGFDCGHAYDYVDMARNQDWRDRWPQRDVYRDMNYVREQCALLARQLGACA